MLLIWTSLKICCLVQSKPFPKQALSAVQVFENSVEKVEITRNKQFLLFSQCFLPIGDLSSNPFKHEIVVCKLLQFGLVFLKCVVWERANPFPQNDTF